MKKGSQPEQGTLKKVAPWEHAPITRLWRLNFVRRSGQGYPLETGVAGKANRKKLGRRDKNG